MLNGINSRASSGLKAREKHGGYYYYSSSEIRIASRSVFRDSSDTVDIYFQNDNALFTWASGPGGMGPGVGVANNSVYYPYAIATLDGTPSWILSNIDESLGISTITMPGGWAYKRQLDGFVYINGSGAITPFSFNYNRYLFTNMGSNNSTHNVYNGTTPGGTFVDVTCAMLGSTAYAAILDVYTAGPVLRWRKKGDTHAGLWMPYTIGQAIIDIDSNRKFQHFDAGGSSSTIYYDCIGAMLRNI